MESADFGQTWKTADGQRADAAADGGAQPGARPRLRARRAAGLHPGPRPATRRAGRSCSTRRARATSRGRRTCPRTWTTARWTGSEWDIQGGDIVSDNNYDTGLLHVEADDLWRIIGPTQPGPQPYNPGGEVAMWVSRDQGRHWKMARQMTPGSEYNHTYVRRPVNAHPDFYALLGRRPRPQAVRLAAVLLQPRGRRLPAAGEDGGGVREAGAGRRAVSAGVGLEGTAIRA